MALWLPHPETCYSSVGLSPVDVSWSALSVQTPHWAVGCLHLVVNVLYYIKTLIVMRKVSVLGFRREKKGSSRWQCPSIRNVSVWYLSLREKESMYIKVQGCSEKSFIFGLHMLKCLQSWFQVIISTEGKTCILLVDCLIILNDHVQAYNFLDSRDPNVSDTKYIRLNTGGKSV